ncbi:unknown [Clostridium sp. CAG:967]|nr:unknown [Clostridium sp. CAG:967]
MMFKKLAQKLNKDRQKLSSAAINPLEVDFDDRKSVFLDKLTRTAVNMYERKCDIKNFSKLVLSDPENDSHNKIMDELFSKGIIDASDDEKLLELSDNSRFLRDLGLID